MKKLVHKIYNKVDVRVVAATNKNFVELVKEKNFREDLFYRLNVITIDLPPLRERKEDIDVLAKSFLQNEASEYNYIQSSVRSFKDYQWKGNVRELESVIKRAVIFAKSDKRNMIQLSDLPKEIVKETKYSFDDLVLDSLRNKKFSHSSITETSKELGNVNRTMISENFRGLVLRTLVENEFDIVKTISIISGTEDDEIKKRVRSKVETFINNIEKDLRKSGKNDFETPRNSFPPSIKTFRQNFILSR